MGKVRYMGKAAWPIYMYWCKMGYAWAIAAVLGGLTGACIAIAGLLVAGTGAWPAIILLAAAGAGCTGAAATRLLFFSTRGDDETGAAIAAGCGAVAAAGTALLAAGGWSIVPGIAAVAVPVACTAFALRRGGSLALYTDGFVIDGRAVMYDDVIAVAWGSGRAVDENVPPEGKGKPVVRLTALDYEHVEKNFGVTHFYAYVVTREAVLVVQPLRHRSESAGNLRNAWACNDYEKRVAREGKA